jgi:hypothetical protein
MHGILAQPAVRPHRNYRNITPSTVPVATMTPRTSSASKSVRSSLMVFTPFMSKIAPIGRFVNLGAPYIERKTMDGHR